MSSLTNKPTGYSETSITPYYRQKFADKVKEVLDWLKENPNQDYSISAVDNNLSVNTVYLRWWQGGTFLVDNAEEYGRVFRDTKITRMYGGPSKGITLKYIPNRTNRQFKANRIEVNSGWRIRVEEFVEEAQSKQLLVVEGVLLAEEDEQYLTNLLDEEFSWTLKENNLIVVKL